MYFTAILSLASIAVGAVIPRQANHTDPCARLVNFYSTNFELGAPALLSNGQDAQECLLSVPFYKDLAAGYLKELYKYVEFQSTLEILKDPPKTYLSKPVDILGGLSTIQGKVEAEQYSSQYTFEYDIQTLISSANDGHFAISSCTTSIFRFSRGAYQLASVSANGLELPQLFLAYNNTPVGGDSSSPVASINGQNATDYITTVAELQGSQDPDARYNSLFPSYAALAGGNSAGLVGTFSANGGLWPGTDLTVVEFEDGSTATIPTLVSVSLVSTDGIVDGQSLFQSLCVPTPTSTTPASNTSSVETGTPTEDTPPETEPDPSSSPVPTFVPPPYPSGPIGYPEPVYADGYNNFAGYYLDEETAVLLIPTFEISPDTSDNETGIVSNLEAEFITTAISSGHSKLIIDLSGNGGGTIALAWNLFRLFFPTEFPYSATRFRRHPAADLVTKILGAVNDTIAAELLSGSNPYVYKDQVRPDQETAVSSVQDLLGDNFTEHGVPVSSLFANFNYTAISSTNSEPIRGYGPVPLNFTTPPYAVEDILILTDGYCASTCTTFVNLMTNVGKVQSIAFGGRPEYGPMQIMGGVRGAQAVQAKRLNDFVDYATQVVEVGITALSDEELQIATQTAPVPLAQWPVVPASLDVNLRNAYQEGDDDLPLQFQYQAADCRLFYTSENYFQPATMWKAAHAAIWGGGDCVQGSRGGVGSLAWRHGDTNTTAAPGGRWVDGWGQ